MMRFILIYLLITVGFWWGIDYVRHMSGKDRWGLTKSLIYAIICSSLALAVMTLIVILF